MKTQKKDSKEQVRYIFLDPYMKDILYKDVMLTIVVIMLLIGFTM